MRSIFKLISVLFQGLLFSFMVQLNLDVSYKWLWTLKYIYFIIHSGYGIFAKAI